MTIVHKTLPTAGAFRAAEFGLVGSSQTFTSPLTKSAQVAELPGLRWRARYEVAPVNGANARAWRAFLASLRGRVNGFYGYDPAFREYAGKATVAGSSVTFDSTSVTFDSTAHTMDASGVPTIGSPFVRQANQTGSILRTGGWAARLQLYAGEYVAFDYTVGGVVLRALHILTADIKTGADGQVNLTVEPPIRVAPEIDAAVHTDKPACSMRLIGDDGALGRTDPALISSFSFEAEQIQFASAG